MNLFKTKDNKKVEFEYGEIIINLDYPEREQMRIYDGVDFVPYKNTLSEIERLRNGIKFALEHTQDNETCDYLNHLLQGTESKSMYHRFDKDE